MLKQQTVPTSLGQLTVSSLTLGELRQLDSLFQEKPSTENSGLASLLRYLPVIRNPHKESAPGSDRRAA